MKEKSCGAVIINDSKVLIIRQTDGYYGFPKGHMENGEMEIDTAVRETKEETNIDIIIENEKRYVINYSPKEGVSKEVVYFIAKPLNNDIKIQDSELLEARWVSVNNVYDILSFDNLKELWKEIYEYYPLTYNN